MRSTRELGARVVLHGADYRGGERGSAPTGDGGGPHLRGAVRRRAVIAGQGTVGLEIVEDLPDVRSDHRRGRRRRTRRRASRSRPGRSDPEVEVVCVQPQGADNAEGVPCAGPVVAGARPATFADGLATRHVGDLPFRLLLRDNHARAVVVDDRTIARAVFLLLERAKVLAEGAGATPLAALLADPLAGGRGADGPRDQRGEPRPVRHRPGVVHRAHGGRAGSLRLTATLPDIPGRLAGFLQVAAEANANVRQVVHDRDSATRGPRDVSISVELEVRDAEHGADVVARFRELGWAVQRSDGGSTGVREPVNRIPSID